MYAELFAKDSGLPLSQNLSHSDRFVMFKTGPVLWVNVSLKIEPYLPRRTNIPL